MIFRRGKAVKAVDKNRRAGKIPAPRKPLRRDIHKVRRIGERPPDHRAVGVKDQREFKRLLPERAVRLRHRKRGERLRRHPGVPRLRRRVGQPGQKAVSKGVAPVNRKLVLHLFESKAHHQRGRRRVHQLPRDPAELAQDQLRQPGEAHHVDLPGVPVEPAVERALV